MRIIKIKKSASINSRYRQARHKLEVFQVRPPVRVRSVLITLLEEDDVPPDYNLYMDRMCPEAEDIKLLAWAIARRMI